MEDEPITPTRDERLARIARLPLAERAGAYSALLDELRGELETDGRN